MSRVAEPREKFYPTQSNESQLLACYFCQKWFLYERQSAVINVFHSHGSKLNVKWIYLFDLRIITDSHSVKEELDMKEIWKSLYLKVKVRENIRSNVRVIYL